MGRNQSRSCGRTSGYQVAFFSVQLLCNVWVTSRILITFSCCLLLSKRTCSLVASVWHSVIVCVCGGGVQVSAFCHHTYIHTNYYYFVKVCVSHIFLFLNRSTSAVFHKTNRFRLVQIFSIQSKWHLPQQIHYVCWHHEGGNYSSAQTFPSNRLLMLNMFIFARYVHTETN